MQNAIYAKSNDNMWPRPSLFISQFRIFASVIRRQRQQWNVDANLSVSYNHKLIKNNVTLAALYMNALAASSYSNFAILSMFIVDFPHENALLSAHTTTILASHSLLWLCLLADKVWTIGEMKERIVRMALSVLTGQRSSYAPLIVSLGSDAHALAFLCIAPGLAWPQCTGNTRATEEWTAHWTLPMTLSGVRLPWMNPTCCAFPSSDAFTHPEKGNRHCVAIPSAVAYRLLPGTINYEGAY